MKICSFIKSPGRETLQIKLSYDSNYEFKNTPNGNSLCNSMQISVILGEFLVAGRSQNVWIKYSAIRHTVKQNVMKFNFNTMKE